MRLSSLFNKIVLGLIIILVPLIGHIIASVMIVRRPGSGLQKVLWILVVWLIPFFGPGLYLLVGRLFFRPLYHKQCGWMVPAVLLLVLICMPLMVALGNG